MGYIYILTSPSGKSYIGQTTRPIQKRLEEHRTGKSVDCRAIYNAIQFYGWDAFVIDWYYCPDEDLNNHEELMIEVLETLAPDGYNLKGGGANGKHSEETKQKMSEAQKGEKSHMFGKTGEKHHNFGSKHSEETIQRMSEAHLGEKHPMWGKHHSEETMQKQSEAQLGIPKSEDTKQKMSEAQLGEKNHKSQRVYQYALDGTFIGSFGSTKEAGRHLKKTNGGSKISSCARGVKGYKTAYKFKWSYDMI